MDSSTSTTPQTSEVLAAPFPLLSITTPQSLICAKQFQDASLPSIFIASYPKSGTTWMQCIVYNLLTKGKRQDLTHISQFTPFFDASGTFDLSTNNLKEEYNINHHSIGAHVFNTHFAWNMLPQQANMKYIYVIRNGKDAMVSFFHHLSNQNDADLYEGTFSEFVELSLAGNMPYGSRVNHVIDWWRNYQKHHSPQNILFVRYEDLIDNLSYEIEKLIAFLELSYTREEVDYVCQFMSFDYMKTHKHQFEPISVPWKEGFEFIRKGKVGDHKTMFSEEDTERYMRAIEALDISQDAELLSLVM